MIVMADWLRFCRCSRGEKRGSLALAITAMVWDALRRGDVLTQAPPGIKKP